MSVPENNGFPPGFYRFIFLRTPRRYREDLLQEAWLAYLDGRNPNTGARNYLHREDLHELRECDLSQMGPAQRGQYHAGSEHRQNCQSRKCKVPRTFKL